MLQFDIFRQKELFLAEENKSLHVFTFCFAVHMGHSKNEDLGRFEVICRKLKVYIISKHSRFTLLYVKTSGENV